MAYTEFYCDPVNGSQTNAGSTTNGTPAYSATNGGWNSVTGVFTPVSGDPSSSVAIGDFLSVYTDGATQTGFVARVTGVNSTTITVSLTDKSGTIPTTAASGISAKAGGCWKGPNSTGTNLPMSVIDGSLKNAAGDPPKVWMKNNAKYSIPSAIVRSISGVTYEGYTTTPGDGGIAWLDGITVGSSYTLLTLSGVNNTLIGIELSNTGATSGTATNGITLTGSENLLRRCIAHDVRGSGFSVSGDNIVEECEAYACNKANSSDQGGFLISSRGDLVRCISHDNTGSNAVGFLNTTNGAIFEYCVADSNGGDGFRTTVASLAQVFRHCDSYNNGGDGLELANASADVLIYIENCNFVKNTGWGVNGSGAGTRRGLMLNCGFGSGSQANGSGATTGLGFISERGSVTYASGVTPWNDPATGDFRITLAAAKNAGRGSFTQVQSGYTGTTGYPDIGSGLHLTSSAGGVTSPTAQLGARGVHIG